MHKLENLKNQVDKLVSIVNNAIRGHRYNYDDGADSKRIRLGVMLLKMQDGELEHRYVSRLGRWLCNDPDAMKYYVDFQQLNAMLRLHYSDSLKSKLADSIHTSI